MWPVIKFAVEQSLPPVVGESPDKINRILSSMLCGELEVWAAYDQESKKFEAVLVTKLSEDRPSNTKSILLYCLYGYSFIGEERWKEGYETISKYAKSQGCSRISAYTNVSRLIEIAKAVGGEVYNYISIPI
jgi:hypothetical protein